MGERLLCTQEVSGSNPLFSTILLLRRLNIAPLSLNDGLNMEVCRSLEEIVSRRPSAVALGFFDGLHIGHQTLIAQCVALAKGRGLSACVFTFSEHPKNVMGGKLSVPRLQTEKEKLERLSAFGVDRVFDFDFADGFHAMSPESFAQSLLKEAFSAEAVFCGFNFRFGAEASGNTEALREYGKKFGFETHVVDPVYVSGKLVSSSLIRHCVNSGEADAASMLLGRDYGLSGVVEKGKKLGREFGFPTANINPAEGMALPAYGVYVTATLANGTLYPSVSNVGVNPTVSEGVPVRVETHLLETDISLYGEEITVFFKKMLREERRFENEKALFAQIATDAESARAFFASA